jgi:hypothetical protein
MMCEAARLRKLSQIATNRVSIEVRLESVQRQKSQSIIAAVIIVGCRHANVHKTFKVDVETFAREEYSQ